MFRPSLVDTDLVTVLRARAGREPDTRVCTFLVDGESEAVSVTCAELDRQARAVATTLQALGARGERALLLFPPGLEYIAAFFGCLYAGVTAVPAYPPDPTRLQRTLPRLQAIVADAGASVALTTAGLLSMSELLFAHTPELESLRWVASDATPPDAAAEWRPPRLHPDRLAFLQYTSGSTGAPRGVMVTHDNLMHNLAVMREAFAAGPGTVSVSWLPPYHDMGLIGFIVGCLYSDGTAVLMSPIAFLQRPVRWLQAISRYRGTIAGAPNFAYDLCARKVTAAERAHLDLRAWRQAGCGAEPVRRETLDRFTATFAECGLRPDVFHPCYGLAESTLIVSGTVPAGTPRVKVAERAALADGRVVEAADDAPAGWPLVSCGRALGEGRIVIVDPDRLTTCPPDRVGEIWVSGPSVAQGYWARAAETQDTFQARLVDTGEGPFLRTGDLGFLHDGELFVTGRLKDLLIIRGRNLHPVDVERTVETSHPALRPGCSAAIAIDGDGEERLVVVQEVDVEHSPDLGAVIEAIRNAVAAAHEVAVHAVVLLRRGTLPKTSSGKVQRRATRDAVLAGTLAPLLVYPTDPSPSAREDARLAVRA